MSRLAMVLAATVAVPSLLAQSAERPAQSRPDLELAADPVAPVDVRVHALVRLLESQSIGLKPGASVATILRDTLVSRCPLAPGPPPVRPGADLLEPLARVTERLYREAGPPALRLFARCARLALAEQLPPPEASGAVVGMVHDTAGRPIEGAEILALAAKRRGRSDDRGEFTIEWLQPGPELFLVRAIGYAPQRFSATLAARDTLPVDVALRLGPQQLDELVVTARGREYRGRLADFARRMATAHVPASRFIVRDEIERWAPFDLRDVFRRAGMTPRDRWLSCSALGVGAPAMGVFLDGLLYSETPEFDLTLLPVGWIEGIEVYKRQSEIPMEFTRPGFGCAVAIWTREP
ncbi:MAG: carboxypeptidase regulatory-like domain-containing protein [Gemmatimonadales bacterium]